MNNLSEVTIIDETTQLLIAAGAAMASNGDVLLKETLTRLAATGVDQELLGLPIFIGQQVKERPAAHMLEVADILVGTDHVSNKEHVCPASKLNPTTHSYKIIMLVSAGAAMAANCEPCLNQVVPSLIEAGVAHEDIQQAVEIGRQVKDRVKTETLSGIMEWMQKRVAA